MMNDMSEIGDKSEKNVLENKELFVELKAQSKKFQILVKTNTIISDLPKVIDEITAKIIQSQSFSEASILDLDTVNTSSSPPLPIPELPPNADLVELFAHKLGVDAPKLVKSKLIGIRDKDIQIIKVSQISPLEAGMLILAIKDLVMNEKPVPYEDWKILCDANGIKSVTPIYKLAGNAKDRGYLDKAKHSDKLMLLKPKGIDFVKKSIESFLNK